MDSSNIVTDFEQLPVSQQSRKCTDIFYILIYFVLFFVLFILACVLYNGVSIKQWWHPSDSIGKTCGIDKIDFPYLYYAQINDMTKRLCLSECPKIQDNQVHSFPSECTNNIIRSQHIHLYDTYPEETNIGKFCFPKDKIIKQRIFQKGGINARLQFIQQLKIIGISIIFALILGILVVIFIQTFPKVMTIVSIFGGTISFIILGILLVALKSEHTNDLIKLSFGILCMLFGALLSIMSAIYRQQLRIIGVFLLQSVVYLIIPVFLIIFAGIIGICIFQFIAFFSIGELVYINSPYYQINNTFKSILLQFINLLGLIWGLNIIRQASTYLVIQGAFIVSGYVIGWYSQKPIDPIKLFFKHLGSVIGCAFMVGFFGIFDLIYLFIAPNKATTNSCAKTTKTILFPLQSLSQFIRQQALAYINLTGVPYCNAAINCQQLSNLNQFSKHQGNKPLIRYYRFAIHSFVVSLLLIFCIVYQNNTIGVIIFRSILIVGLLGYFILGVFVNIHADMASTLLVSFMFQNELLKQNQNIPSVKNERIRSQIEKLSN